MSSEQVQLILGAFGAMKSLEWIFKYLYSRRREKKYVDRLSTDIRAKIGDMEINLINQIGGRLDKKYHEAIEKINTRLEYLERQVSNLNISHASIQNVMEELKKYFNKEIEKIENQYRLILQAIRSRAKK